MSQAKDPTLGICCGHPQLLCSLYPRPVRLQDQCYMPKSHTLNANPRGYGNVALLFLLESSTDEAVRSSGMQKLSWKNFLAMETSDEQLGALNPFAAEVQL